MENTDKFMQVIADLNVNQARNILAQERTSGGQMPMMVCAVLVEHERRLQAIEGMGDIPADKRAIAKND